MTDRKATPTLPVATMILAGRKGMPEVLSSRDLAMLIFASFMIGREFYPRRSDGPTWTINAKQREHLVNACTWLIQNQPDSAARAKRIRSWLLRASGAKLHIYDR